MPRRLGTGRCRLMPCAALSLSERVTCQSNREENTGKGGPWPAPDPPGPVDQLSRELVRELMWGHIAQAARDAALSPTTLTEIERATQRAGEPWRPDPGAGHGRTPRSELPSCPSTWGPGSHFTLSPPWAACPHSEPWRLKQLAEGSSQTESSSSLAGLLGTEAQRSRGLLGCLCGLIGQDAHPPARICSHCAHPDTPALGSGRSAQAHKAWASQETPALQRRRSPAAGCVPNAPLPRSAGSQS